MTVADAPGAEQRQWLTPINQRQGPGGRLRAQVKRFRSQVQALGGQVARQVSELLASTGD